MQFAPRVIFGGVTRMVLKLFCQFLSEFLDQAPALKVAFFYFCHLLHSQEDIDRIEKVKKPQNADYQHLTNQANRAPLSAVSLFF